ncbi:MAG: methyltransferase domain-containing protein [Clostridia bacterium]|nr:methyltransferase domain-containing protein [Clostridia bacterium]
MDLTMIGSYIALLRRERGLSQRELAGRLGVSCQAVSKWENGENLPDASILLPLSEVLHTTADALLSAGSIRLRRPLDVARLMEGVAALHTVRDTFGEASLLWQGMAEGVLRMTGQTAEMCLRDGEGRERLLAEAVVYHLQHGGTLDERAIDAAFHDEALRARIRKCRHDCALFVDKQNHYDDYRPSYPAQAIEMIRQRAGECAAYADMGSGTGKLAVLLAPGASQLYAVEPSESMRRVLEQRTQPMANVTVVAASAEHTHLPDHCVDVITVGEAYHWFDNVQTRAEFRRILKPGGWVFLLWNHFEHNDYDEAMQSVQQQYRTYPRPRQRTRNERADDLYGKGRWQRFAFDNTMHQPFERFYGGMTSASYAPEPGTVAGEHFRREVQRIFDQHAVNGQLTTHVTTVCYAGQLADGAPDVI